MSDKERSTTFAERMETVVKDARKEHESVAKNEKINSIVLNDRDEQLAKVSLSLINTPMFKKYLELEALEIANRLNEAFDDPGDLIKTDEFACKMAFNKGRYYQSKFFKDYRDNAIKRYLNKMKLKSEV